MPICGATKLNEYKQRAQKKRPCVVVRRQEESDGSTPVFVLPITHTEPFDTERAIDCPVATKQRLGLDEQAS